MSLIALAAIGAATGIASLISGSVSRSQQLNIQQQQLELQRKQNALQEQQYYDSLTSNYYSYLSSLEDMRSAQGSAGLAINQERENIASNQYYLSRWADEYRSSMESAQDEAFNAYSTQMQALGNANAQAGATGQTGGSAAIISGLQRQQVKNLVGTNGGFNLGDSYLGRYVSGVGQDLLAERQTASSAIGTSYTAIGSYQDAITSLDSAISSMGGTAEEIKKRLKEQGRAV